MMRTVVAVMTRAPSVAGKSRLLGALGLGSRVSASIQEAVRLREALLRDTLDRVDGLGAERAVLFTPASAEPALRTLAGPSVMLRRQRGADLGQRMRAGVRDLLVAGFNGVILVGSDLPSLPPAYVRQAIAILAASPASLVLGPANDGGYYLLATTRVPDRAIFRQVEWGTGRALQQTLRAAAAIDTPVELLPPWTDVDSPADLAHVCATTHGSTACARHTRAWLAAATPTIRRRLARAWRADITGGRPRDRARGEPTG